MKILALRVAAFRRFVEPVAIETFGDGVNVLCGPNEMGKSTMFHALEAAFLTRHKVSGGALDAMRPYGGGEPLVEVDFEAQGRRWHIRKQFGRGASALLSDLDSGAIVARNAEAEERLAELTGRSSDLPGSFGLVWVRQKQTLSLPEPDIDPAGKVKDRGERAILRDVIGREIETAAFDAAFEGVRDRTKRALDLLLTPSRAGIKKDGPLYVAQQLRDDAKKERDETRTIAQAAEQRLNDIVEMTRRLGELEAEVQSNASGSGTLALEARRAAAIDTRSQRDLAREAMRAREAEHAAALGALASRKKLAEALDQKRAGYATAVETGRQIGTWTSEIEADPALPGVIDRLGVLEQQRAVAEAELSGHAATVDIAVEEGGRGRIEIGGSPLQESRSFAVVEPLEIRIPGIAAISISTAHAARGAELRAKSEAATREIEDALKRLGVATTEQARERAQARAKKQADLAAARARLSDLAPRGAEVLASDIAQIEAELAAVAQASLSEPDVERLKSVAMDARLTFNALSAQAMDDDDFRRLDGEIVAARKTEENRKSEIGRLRDELAHAKGAQQASDENGRAGELAAREGEFERAEAEAQRLRHEAEALRLLERTLAAIEAQAKAAYSAPISRRLGRHLERVFGTSELTFRDDFAVDALRRAAGTETVTALSDGTREQLSILVRLTFAEILAESGRGVPLVVDDPLAYSDDARLAAVCGELAAASSVPQIIVLTCRERAFEILPGRRLTVTNWRPER
ncbi:ATP-binding protein [Hyphomicrobium facile]|uniref:AAA domain-containing protein n=1 Tax=Hyphomicrobium facile TaxID=51670 RepID=A0A1I7N0E0_9HYPH|nr:AAA family ATPase [Hyphomicrobium facile]SFV28147.1 AAA domain-containing protein [Hyphomicrobium facile]